MGLTLHSMSIFNSVMFPKVQENTFDLSHDIKLSCNMGDLIPIHLQEVVPGDKITMSSESLLRMAPMIAPVMHKVDVYQHFFFVPNRILWPGWEDFITNEAGVAAPYLANLDVNKGDLADYLGLPISSNIDKVSALPFAAYSKIYNEYYRDQNLEPDNFTPLVDGSQPIYPVYLRKRAWEHDYFTSALPFAQKGDAVTLPIGTFTDVGVYYAPNMAPTSGLKNRNTGTAIGSATQSLYVQGDGVTDKGAIGSTSTMNPKFDYDPGNTMYARTSDLEAESSTINDLRRAFRLQEWLEKNARGGTRYIESILSHFGVRSSDKRLNRPEYLGGSKQNMVISEVLQTGAPDADFPTPQGNMAGHGISVGGGKQFSFYCEEHGFIMGIMSIRPKTAYQQGIPKHFSKFDKLQYYWPSFAHLGEQEIQNRELYYDETDHIANQWNDKTFGYTPRYAEYKFLPSRVAGDFRDSLSFWHMGRIFASRPNLNQDFVQCNPTTRIFAVEEENENKVYAHIFHRIKAKRKMPKYGTPTF